MPLARKPTLSPEEKKSLIRKVKKFLKNKGIKRRQVENGLDVPYELSNEKWRVYGFSSFSEFIDDLKSYVVRTRSKPIWAVLYDKTSYIEIKYWSLPKDRKTKEARINSREGQAG